jgi:hypothetical protein
MVRISLYCGSVTKAMNIAIRSYGRTGSNTRTSYGSAKRSFNTWNPECGVHPRDAEDQLPLFMLYVENQADLRYGCHGARAFQSLLTAPPRHRKLEQGWTPNDFEWGACGVDMKALLRKRRCISIKTSEYSSVSNAVHGGVQDMNYFGGAVGS